MTVWERHVCRGASLVALAVLYTIELAVRVICDIPAVWAVGTCSRFAVSFVCMVKMIIMGCPSDAKQSVK